jgi:hypothetical protein
MKTSTSPALITFALVCFALVQNTQAVSPPPDGGYPGGNTAEGQNALLSLTSGMYNTAVGLFSLLSNTEGDFNTAIGAGALLSNIGGFQNTPHGVPQGSQNTATGAGALLSNTTGGFNTADGAFVLFNNTTGSQNTANGEFAVFSNTTGAFNTATGSNALQENTTGSGNTANGASALFSNTGSNNTAVGVGAGSSLTTGDNNIDIGNSGVDGESDTVRIGSEFQTRTFIAAIRGVTTGIADAVNVVIDSNGQLGTISSSARFKKEIKPIESASESILSLNPVTFYYKSDKANTPQFGLIAEEVATVNPDLVVRDKNGEIYTVRYDAVNAMLLNEFLKEHRKVEEQGTTIAKQQKQIDALTTSLQKVNARLEMSRPAPQVAESNH